MLTIGIQATIDAPIGSAVGEVRGLGRAGRRSGYFGSLRRQEDSFEVS